MRVALDLTPMAGPRSGIAEFTRQLAAGLPRRCDVLGYVLSARQGALPGWTGPLVRVRLPGRVVLPLAERGLVQNLGRLTAKVDLVHATNFAALGGWRRPTLLTIHDLTPLRYPEYCTATVRAAFRVTRRNLADGAFVHTPSAYVAAEVVSELGVPPDRVRAIPLGIGARVAPRPVAELEGLEPTIVFLGTLEPRKGLGDLVRAFETLPGEPHLVLAGRPGWAIAQLMTTIESSPVRARIHLPGPLDDAAREWLYQHTTLFVFPSHYEGFGLPPLEAMARGVPVVTTDAGALPEVTAGGARLVPARDPEALASAIATLLADDAARATLAAQGAQAVRRYDWDRTLDELSAFYDAIVSATP